MLCGEHEARKSMLKMHSPMQVVQRPMVQHHSICSITMQKSSKKPLRRWSSQSRRLALVKMQVKKLKRPSNLSLKQIRLRQAFETLYEKTYDSVLLPILSLSSTWSADKIVSQTMHRMLQNNCRSDHLWKTMRHVSILQRWQRLLQKR